MINQDNITSLTGKQFVYYTSNNGNARMYILKSIDRIGDGFAVCKVVDKSHDSKTGNKQVFKTLRFGRIDRDGMRRYQPKVLVNHSETVPPVVEK